MQNKFYVDKRHCFYKTQSTVTSILTVPKLPHFCSNNIPCLVGLSVLHGVLTRKIHT
jgi:hypothetical protein